MPFVLPYTAGRVLLLPGQGAPLAPQLLSGGRAPGRRGDALGHGPAGTAGCARVAAVGRAARRGRRWVAVRGGISAVVAPRLRRAGDAVGRVALGARSCWRVLVRAAGPCCAAPRSLRSGRPPRQGPAPRGPIDRTLRARPGHRPRERAGRRARARPHAGVERLDEYDRAVTCRPGSLAVPVPLLVARSWSSLIDPLTPLVLLFAGPVLLVLLALIGSRTQATRRAGAELAWMSAHFLDLLRGLPTLKLFGRSREQADTMARSAPALRRRTMDVLRTAFQTSLVLEWGATAATALVADRVSFRLMARRAAVRPGAGGAADHAGVLPAPAPAGAPLPRRRRGPEGRGRGHRVLDGRGAGRGRPPPVRAGPVGARLRTCRPARDPRSMACAWRYPGSGDPASALTLTFPPGGRSPCGGGDRRRQVARWRGPAALRRAGRGIDHGRRAPLGAIDPAAWRAQASRWVPAAPAPVRRHDRRQPPAGAAGRHGRRAPGRARGGRGAPTSWPRCPTASTRRSARTARGSAAASGSGSPSPARLLRGAPLLSLDEPTAHLDPTTEEAVAASLVAPSGARTAILRSRTTRGLPRPPTGSLVLERGRLSRPAAAALLATGGASAGCGTPRPAGSRPMRLARPFRLLGPPVRARREAGARGAARRRRAGSAWRSWQRRVPDLARPRSRPTSRRSRSS